MQTLAHWIGEDDPTRLDSAAVTFDGTRMTAHGSQHCSQWSLTWSLECDDSWVTRRMRVFAVGDGWSRALDLTNDGRWRATTFEEGITAFPSAGPTSVDGLTDALDCDLGLCPLTNTMPIRRLGLLETDHPETLLTMAWIDVPSLQVIPVPQRYSSAGGSVQYESERRDFRSQLSVDADGIVIDYPQLARRLRSGT